MNRKTFTLASFATAFGILFLGSFYAWLISQFNEAKFTSKLNYYFNKNFPRYTLEISDINFRVSNKLRYEITNLEIKDKKNNKKVLSAPYLVLDIPVGAFLGNREIRLKTKDMKIYYKNSKSFKSVFFSNQEESQVVQLDLPKLVDNNKFSLKAENLSLLIDEKNYKKTFKKVFFKNLNMSHYTAFELEGVLEDGSYRLYGEVDLGNFLKTRNIQLEAYLAFRNFSETKSYVNNFVFKVMTEPSESAYNFKLLGNSDNIKGEMNLVVNSTGLKLNFENLVTTEKFIRDQLLIDQYYECEKSQKTNLDGFLAYEYDREIWEPNYTVLGDCVQVKHSLKSKNPYVYLSEVKFIEEQGIEIKLESKDFFISKSSLQQVELNRKYLDYNTQSNLNVFVSKISKIYETTSDSEKVNFPININIEQIEFNKKNYSLEASGIATNDGVAFEKIFFKNGSKTKGSGSLVYSHLDNDLNYSFELFDAPAPLLNSFLDDTDLILKGLITKGRISQQVENKEVKKAFSINIDNGEFEWANLFTLMNKKIFKDKNDSSDELMWDKKFENLNFIGKMVKDDLEIAWKLNPSSKSAYKRSGSVKKLAEDSFYTLDVKFEKMKNTEFSVKLEKSNNFKIIQ